MPVPARTAPVLAAAGGLLRGFLTTQVICMGIAGVLWAMGSSKPLQSWLYSALIGTCCWALIDGGRRVIAAGLRRRGWVPPTPAERDWPGWRWMAPVVAFGGAAGFLIGSTAAGLILGHTTVPGALVHWRGSAGALVISMLAAVGTTGYYWTRSRMAAVEAAAADLRRQATEARLKLLETQLEPHMLFNTLANLRVLIGLQPAAAQAMLDRLIAYLRATLSASRAERHPLRDELARLEDYLALMAVRMGPRLAHRFVLPDGLAGWPVPPLLLQPLVENAITHGLEPKVEGGRIEITAAAQDGGLALTVRDTGVGLHPVPGRAPTAGTGFGTEQVRERLASIYGGRARFSLTPAADADGGAVAALWLPPAPTPETA